MINLIIDTSKATEEEIKELEKIIPFKTQKFFFDKNNINIIQLTPEDNKIAESNNTNIQSGLYKNVILGCTSREDADLLSNNHKE